MTNKIKYFFIIPLLILVFSANLMAQGPIIGSWAISSQEEIGTYKYKNYQLLFNKNGIQESTELDNGIITGSGSQRAVFNGGAYKCDANYQDFYVMGRHYFFGEEFGEWEQDGNLTNSLQSEFQIIKSLNDDDDYKMFYTNNYGGSPVNQHTSFHIINVGIDNGVITFDNTILYLTSDPTHPEGNNGLGFIISNLDTEQNEKYLYIVTGDGGDAPADGDYGLHKYIINDSGVEFDEILLGETESSEFVYTDFRAYNLEMQNKSENENPMFAWIKEPKPGDDSKIFIYHPDGEYFIDLDFGAIGGIEFSPFENEEDYLYLSCENHGIIKLNYVNNNYTMITGTSNFGHTYLQTAPDGNIYAVADNGRHLGMINKSTGLFNENIFEYGFGSTYYSHNAFVELGDNNNTKYYTLPENDFQLLNIELDITPEFCDVFDAKAKIKVNGGIKPYYITVINELGTDISSSFVWNEDDNEFYANYIELGGYQYTISDSDTPICSKGGYFEVTNEDIWDFEEMLIINETEAENIHGLEAGNMVWDLYDNEWGNPYEGFYMDDAIMFKKGFILNNNTTLTINDLKLEFDENFLAKVIIEPGSKLILNNTVLTNYHCSDVAKKWAGVEVWGNKNETQTTQFQGKLEMYNSTIEHAHEAVRLYKPDDSYKTGGMIYAENSQFLNNRRAVSFLSYENFNNWNYEENYRATFKQCTFKNDNDYLNDNAFYTFVTMWKVRGVKFYACDFINSPAFPDSKAIYTLDAGYKFNGYCDGASGPNGCLPNDWETNSFTGFLKAIESSNTFFDPNQYAINIFDSEFDDNQHGIFMTTVNNAATILNNEFIIGDNGYANFEKGECGYFSARGIQMNGSFGFAIEENTFDKANSTNSGDIVGVLVNDCPSTADDIYKNNFNDLTVGNQAEKVNRFDVDDDQFGVSYMCNINQGNSIDFFITEDESRIRHNVGYDSLASGNVFSNTDMQFRNDFTEIVEFYYYDSPDAPNEKLEYFTPYYVQSKPTTNQNTCLSHFGGGIGEDPKLVLSDDEKIATEQVFYLNHQDYESVSNLLEELKDGGSTEITNLTIAAAQPSDTWELRANLLGMSPYLSKEVLMEASDKTNVLPESVIFEILSANPDELQKADLLDYLENKAQPLPDYMIAILRQMSNGVSAKTAMLSQKAYYFSKKNIAAQSMIRSIKNEDELDILALRNWLGNVGSFENDKQVVSTYLYEENYTAANNLLNLIPDLYNLEGESLEEFNDYKDLLNLQITLQQDDRNIFMLNDSEKSQLLVLAEYSQGDAKYGARNILSFVYGDNYCDCISPVSGGNKSTISSQVYAQDDIAHAMGLSVSVKPNPANIYASFDYTLPIGVEQATLQIINVEGKTVYSCQVNGTQGQISLDIRRYKSGVYIYKILAGDYSISESLIIQ